MPTVESTDMVPFISSTMFLGDLDLKVSPKIGLLQKSQINGHPREDIIEVIVYPKFFWQYFL